MNPILLYPQNAADAKFFRECAKKRGAKPTRLPSKILERLDEIMFAEKLVARSKNAKIISNEQLDATFERLIDGK